MKVPLSHHNALAVQGNALSSYMSCNVKEEREMELLSHNRECLVGVHFECCYERYWDLVKERVLIQDYFSSVIRLALVLLDLEQNMLEKAFGMLLTWLL